jgi:hypothetical protein
MERSADDDRPTHPYVGAGRAQAATDTTEEVATMYARLVTFDLQGPSHEDYCAHASAIADAFNQWPGLRAKLWLADQRRSRYGGIYLFERSEDAHASRRTAEFASLQTLPMFTGLSIEEFDILREPSAITAPYLVAAAAAT